MFIVRVSSKNKQEQEIRTFTFDTEKDMEKAVSVLTRIRLPKSSGSKKSAQKPQRKRTKR